MKMTYKIEVINFAWETNKAMLLIEYKINSGFRRIRVLREDIKATLVSNLTHQGLSDTNIEDVLNEQDAKYSFKDEFLIKFLELHHKI